MQDEPYGLSDEELAALQQDQQRARDEADAAAAEDAELIGHAQDAEDALDPHGEEREALGFDLAWWADEGEQNTPPLDIVVDLTNQACGRTHYSRDLEQYGYDPSAYTGYIGLDAVTGPLVVAGLQILGTLHSHIRDEVTAVLKQIYECVPEATEEQNEIFRNAAEQLERAKLTEFAQAMGVEVMTPDEFAEKIVEADDARRESELN